MSRILSLNFRAAACREEMGAPVGYMAIQSFGTNTGQDAAAALHSLHAQGASAYVIDLRGNSGGLVSAGETTPWPIHSMHVLVSSTFCSICGLHAA